MALLDTLKGLFRRKKDEEDVQLTGNIPLNAPAINVQPVKMDAQPLSTPKIEPNNLQSALKGVDLKVSAPTIPQSQPAPQWKEPLEPVMNAADAAWNNPAVAKARKWLADRPIIDTNPLNIAPQINPNIEIGKMGTVYEMGKDVIQAFPRALLRVMMSRDTAGGSPVIKPQTRLEKLIFGENDITSIQEGMSRAKKTLNDWGVKNPGWQNALAGVGVIGGTALDLTPVELNAGKKAAIKTTDELASVLEKGLKPKILKNLDEAFEPVKVAWKDAEAALKEYRVDKSILRKLANGEAIEGANYIIQKQGKELMLNIDQGFKPVQEIVSKVKGVKLGSKKAAEEIVPEVKPIAEVVDNAAPVVEKAAVDVRYVDPKTYAKSIDRGKAAGRKKLSELKMPEYWKPEEIDRAQVDQYKLSIQNGNKIDPIVTDEAGNVLDGAHRLQALQELGVDDVETVVQKAMTAKQQERAMKGVQFKVNQKQTDSIKQFKQNQKMLEREAADEMGQSTDEILQEMGQAPKPGEGVSFMATAKESAAKAGNEDLLRRSMAKVDPKLNTISEFAAPLKETGTLENAADKVIGAITNNKVYRAIADPVSEIVHKTVGKFRFADEALDVDTKAIERAKIGFVEQAKNTYKEAKAEVESILGRAINEEEAGALLRGNYRAERKLVREGVTNLPLGTDITRRAPTLQKVFSEVHAEIGSYVLMYEKELDDLVRTGKLSAEEAAKMRLVEPKQFGKNLDKYVRTFYNADVQDFATTPLNTFAVEETRVNFSTAKRKLTDMEWGKGYIQALQAGHPEEVSRVMSLADSDLVKRALGGDKDAIMELGRQVKSLRGYVTQGDAVVERTVYNLLNSYRDLKLESIVADRDDLFSTVMKQGFVPIPKDKGYGPLAGKYVQEDTAKELFADKEQIESTTDMVKNTVALYGALWRYSKTVLNPATWVLNGLTGLMGMQTLAGNAVTNPKNWKYYAQGLEIFGDVTKATSKTAREFLDLGGLGTSFVDVEIIGAIKEVFEEKAVPKLLEKLAEKTVYFAKQGEKLGEYYAYLDGYNKYVTFLQKIDKGYSPVEAMKIADKYHLNYAIAPKFVRGIKQNIYASVLLPFASFPMLFGRMFVETAVTKPWRLTPMLLIPMAWNASWATRNPELAKQAEAQKPEYLRNNPFVLTLGYNEQNKEFSYYDMSRIFNIPTTGDQGSRFFLGPFAGVGGPFAAVTDATKGIDSFGNPLNAPGNETTGEHLVKGMAPVPNLVFQIADIYKTVTGQPARGRMRNPLDEVLKVAGITIIRASQDQMKREVAALEREFSDWMSYTKQQFKSKGISPETKQKMLQDLQTKRTEYQKKIAERIGNYTDATPDQQAQVGVGIIKGLEGTDLLDTTIPTIDTTTIPSADLPVVDAAKLGVDFKGKSSSKKPKATTIPKPKGVSFKVSKPKASDYTLDVPEFKAPPEPKGVQLSRAKSTKKVAVKRARVSGLRVS